MICKEEINVGKEVNDKFLLKVPSLRINAETWPYLQDGSVKDLDKTIQIMAKMELGKEVTPEQTSDMIVFMKALTGELPAEVKQAPAMP